MDRQEYDDSATNVELPEGFSRIGKFILLSGSWRNLSGFVVRSGSRLSGQHVAEMAATIWDEAAAQGFLLAPKTYRLAVAGAEDVPRPPGPSGAPALTAGLPQELHFQPEPPSQTGPLRQYWLSRNNIGCEWQLVIESVDGKARGTLSAVVHGMAVDSGPYVWTSTGVWEFFGENRLSPSDGTASEWHVDLLVAAK